MTYRDLEHGDRVEHGNFVAVVDRVVTAADRVYLRHPLEFVSGALMDWHLSKGATVYRKDIPLDPESPDAGGTW